MEMSQMTWSAQMSEVSSQTIILLQCLSKYPTALKAQTPPRQGPASATDHDWRENLKAPEACPALQRNDCKKNFTSFQISVFSILTTIPVYKVMK